MYTKRAASGGSSGCGSNRPGHDPHFIQVLRVAPQRPHHAVEDLDITGSTGVLLRVDGVWLRLNNHRNGRVLAAWHNRGGAGWWVPEARLLRIEHKDGNPCFDLAPDSQYRPCTPAGTVPPAVSSR
jgi:hypothetical protein